MEIYIMRHGKPDVSMLSNKRMASKDLLEGLEIYDSCGILKASKPEDTTLDRFREFSAVVSSDLKRSIESALLLCSQQSLIVDALFREVEEVFFKIPILKFTPRTWGNIILLFWFIGLLELKRSFRAAKIRAKRCADKLIGLAEEHGKVLLVGHGFINTYIAKELVSLGWDGPKIKMPNRRYWGYDVYKNKAS